MSCMKKYVEEDRFFSCVSAQFRCGAATPIKEPETWLNLPEGEERKKNKYGWHVDWCPSIFHMAVSLRGTRIVHGMLDGRTDEPKPQSAGDVYIGCPGYFDHAVEFLEMEEDAPVLSLQARTLIPSRTAYDTEFSKHDFQALRAHICKVLQEGEVGFVLPTRQQVLDALQHIDNLAPEQPSTGDLCFLDSPPVKKAKRERPAGWDQVRTMSLSNGFRLQIGQQDKESAAISSQSEAAWTGGAVHGRT